jgi:hypothetical protein
MESHTVGGTTDLSEEALEVVVFEPLSGSSDTLSTDGLRDTLGVRAGAVGIYRSRSVRDTCWTF